MHIFYYTNPAPISLASYFATSPVIFHCLIFIRPSKKQTLQLNYSRAFVQLFQARLSLSPRQAPPPGQWAPSLLHRYCRVLLLSSPAQNESTVCPQLAELKIKATAAPSKS